MVVWQTDSFAISWLLPKPKASQKRIGVIAGSAAGRQVAQLLDVAATEHHVVGFEGGDQLCDHVRHVVSPFLFASAVEATLTDVVLEGSLLVGKMRQLHRLDDAFDNHRCAKART